MFGNLVGTPRGKYVTRSNLEFTPIGKHSTRENAKLSPLRPSTRANVVVDKVNKNMDSTFENTVDNFSQTINSIFQGDIREDMGDNYQNYRETGEIPRPEAESHQLINNGSSIKQQQHQFESLKKENVGLKVQLFVWERYYRQTPEKQKEMLNENIELRQKLFELSEENRKLELSLGPGGAQEVEIVRKEYQGKIEILNEKLAEKESQFEYEIQDLKRQYKEMLDERDFKVEQMEQEIFRLGEHLEHSSERNKVSEEGLRDVDKLKYQNQELKIDLDELNYQNSDLKKSVGELSNLNQKLKKSVDELDNFKYRAQELEQQNKELKYQNQGLQNQINELEHNLTNQESGNKNDNRRLIQELEHKQNEIGELNMNIDQWKARYERLTKDMKHGDDSLVEELSFKYEASKAELEKLTFKYETSRSELERIRHELEEARNAQYNDKHSTEKLKHELKNLQQELQARELEEGNLRAQINSLIKNKSQSHDEYYENQIESLRSNERKVLEMNRKLNKEIAELKDEIFLMSSNSGTNDSKIQRQNKELQDKLAFYESEFETVEQAFKSSEREVQELQEKMKMLDTQYQILQQDNENLMGQIRDGGSSAIEEFENFSRQKLQADNESLIAVNEGLKRDNEVLRMNTEELKRGTEGLRVENDKLQFEIRKISRQLDGRPNEEYIDQMNEELNRLRGELSRLRTELDRERSSKPEYRNDRFIEQEYQRILSERNQLNIELDTSFNRLRDLENKYKKLQLSYQDKENLLDDVEMKLREVKRVNKFSQLEGDDEKISLIKSNANNEAKVKALEIELDSLRKEYGNQISMYQSKIDVLNQKTKIQTPLTPPESNLGRIDELYKDKGELYGQLSELKSKEQRLTMDLEASHREIESLTKKLEASRVNEESKKEIETLKKEISNILDLNNTFDKNEKLLKMEIEQLESTNKSIKQELTKVNSHREKLLDKLRQKYNDERNNQLEKKINELNDKLRDTNLSKSPKNKVWVYEQQIKYYKLKLYEVNLKANDLQLMYEFVKKSNDKIEGQLKHHLGQGELNKPTFAVVAKMVLAMVRMRNRVKKSDKRRVIIDDIRMDLLGKR